MDRAVLTSKVSALPVSDGVDHKSVRYSDIRGLLESSVRAGESRSDSLRLVESTLKQLVDQTAGPRELYSLEDILRALDVAQTYLAGSHKNDDISEFRWPPTPEVIRPLVVSTGLSTLTFGTLHFLCGKFFSTAPTAPLSAMNASQSVLSLGATRPAFWLELRRLVAQTLGLGVEQLYIVDAARRREITLYVLSQIHAGVTAVWAVMQLRRRGGFFAALTGKAEETSVADAQDPSYRQTTRLMLGFINGFFAHDLFALLKSGLWREDYSSVIHHLIGMSICASISATGTFFEKLPDAMILEISTIFLNAGWLMREFGRSETRKAKAIMASFVLSFFALRVCYFPWMIYVARKKQRSTWDRFGRLTWVIYAAQLLQWYWFVKLVKMLKVPAC